MDSATASVPTASGSKYLQQLCKHWQHNLAVEFTPEHGTIVFPKDARGADHPGDGLVTFDAGTEALDTRGDVLDDVRVEPLCHGFDRLPDQGRSPQGLCDQCVDRPCHWDAI